MTIKGLLHFNRLPLLWCGSWLVGTGLGLSVWIGIREDNLKVVKIVYYYFILLIFVTLRLEKTGWNERVISVKCYYKGLSLHLLLWFHTSLHTLRYLDSILQVLTVAPLQCVHFHHQHCDLGVSSTLKHEIRLKRVNVYIKWQAWNFFFTPLIIKENLHYEIARCSAALTKHEYHLGRWKMEVRNKLRERHPSTLFFSWGLSWNAAHTTSFGRGEPNATWAVVTFGEPEWYIVIGGRIPKKGNFEPFH